MNKRKITRCTLVDGDVPDNFVNCENQLRIPKSKNNELLCACDSDSSCKYQIFSTITDNEEK